MPSPSLCCLSFLSVGCCAFAHSQCQASGFVRVQWKGKDRREGGAGVSGRVWTAEILVPSGIDFHAKAYLIHMALKPQPLSFQPTKTHTNGQRANSSLMLSGPPPHLSLSFSLSFSTLVCTHECACIECIVFTHVVIILWLFFERQIVKCQIRPFAVLQGPDWGPKASIYVCRERFCFDCFYPVRVKGKRSNIYCLDCGGLQDKHGLSIVLIITGIELEEKSKRTEGNFFLSRCVQCFLGSTNLTST